MADTPTMLLAAAASVALAAQATDAAGAEPSPPVTIGVDRTAFAVRLPDGTVLAQEELVGAVLDARDEAAARSRCGSTASRATRRTRRARSCSTA
jgi:hypothetical protein